MQTESIRDIFPGDPVTESGIKDYGIYNGRANIAGTLSKIEDLYFIKSKTKIYIPRKYDIVIGRIYFSSSDYYKVDLSGCTGILPALSFINATKKNKIELEKNSLVVCQVLRVENNEVLLSCKKEGLGKVDEVFNIENWKIRLFYFNDFIKNISKNRTFKIIMAINGFIWLEGDADTKLEILKLINSF